MIHSKDYEYISKDAYDDAQLTFVFNIDNVLVRRQNEVLAIDWFGWMKMCVITLWYFESDGIL